jgi:hypothetical protein
LGKPGGKSSLGGTRHRWEDDIKVLREIRWSDIDWIDMAKDR